jgi:7-carboxy-7-deazaguanine synthase
VPQQIMDAGKEEGLWINEVFTSIQGEGNLMGLPTVFLRTTGCHLRCSWCDTPYSFHEGAWLSTDEILQRLEEAGPKRLCLTGGEPLLQRDAWPIVRRLLDAGWQVTIETSGSLGVEEASRIRDEMGEKARARLLLSVDVKCPGSGEHRSWRKDNLQHLMPHDQLKFIITDEDDYAWAKTWVQQHSPLVCPAWFHPEGGTNGKVLTMIAKRLSQDNLEARLGVQLHKLAWGEKRGV